MKNDQKKPAFEPVSAEEAKKIRAFEKRNTAQHASGTDCGSGASDSDTACLGKPEGVDCCYFHNGQEVHGTCVYDPSGTEALKMKCVDHKWEWPDK